MDGIHLTAIDHPDAERLVQFLNDKDLYNTTCSIPYPYTISDAKTFITAVLRFEKENKIQRDWAIRNAEGQLIGGIGLLFEQGINSHRSELGYWLGKPFWNQGIMTKVLMHFADFTFSTTNLIRLEAQVFEGNEASCAVLEKAGFEREGFQRKAILKDQQYRGIHLWAKIKP